MSTSHVVSSRPTAREPEGVICRYSLDERVHHWVGAFSYIYCLITGLAFWSPYMYWLATLVGGGPTARFWHPWFGLGFTLSMFWMYKMWYRDVQMTDADRRWSKAMKYYIENEDEKVPRPAVSTMARSYSSGSCFMASSCWCFRAWGCGSWNPFRGVCAGCVIPRLRFTWLQRWRPSALSLSMFI